MKTTLNRIRKHDPYPMVWTKLLQNLGKTQADDEPLSLITILESNGLDHALWCLRAVEGRDREIEQYAVDCAHDVQHLIKDDRDVKTLDISERYLMGKATLAEVHATLAGRAAARDIALVAADAAWVAAIAARDAAREAARTEWRGRGPTARTVAMSAYDDIQAKQEQRFREMVTKAEGQS